jgi:hypothetical protein
MTAENISDHEILQMAEDIFQQLRAFDNPQDAQLVLIQVQFELLCAMFTSRERALVTVDVLADLMKDKLRKETEWQ